LNLEFFFIALAVLYGIFVAVLPFLFFGLSGRVRTLEETQRKLIARLGQVESAEAEAPSAAEPGRARAAPAREPAVPQPAEPEPVTAATAPPTPPPRSEAVSRPEAAATAPADEISDAFGRLIRWIMGSLTLARVGIVVLLFGVAFLLRYAAEHGFLPIELRLAGAALGGLALLGIGWRLRSVRHGYAMILQGGGIGIVYLTVFAAVSMYALVPAMPGQVLMVVLVALAAALAVLQNSQGLAFFAVAGGFLAPVLISRGGSHVVLFTYYAILDAGILGMAWFRAWRALNLAGFVFTFVIGSLWGYRFYQPEFFATTEPFLVLFFVFYVAVAVLYALRQAPDLKGTVDGTLVFGVPLVSAALQAALVRDFEYGLAWSAFGAGVFYVLLAAALWIRGRESLRLLVEAFLALGIAFATLAIPYAVDGRVTAAAWALEGAALVWVGVRQQRLLARLSGLGLQVAAGVTFLLEADARAAAVPVLNSLYLSGLMIALGGLISAYHLYRGRERLSRNEPKSPALLVWGMLWWFGAGLYEIWEHALDVNRAPFSLVFVAASATLFAWLARPTNWPQLRYPPLVLLPFMVLTAVFWFVFDGESEPFGGWSLGAWPLAFAVQYGLLWRFHEEWSDQQRARNHVVAFWLALFVLSWELVWHVERVVDIARVWPFVAWLALPTLAVWIISVSRRSLPWPLRALRNDYMMPGIAPVAVVIALWALLACFREGDPSPLPYVPVVNPLELMQLAVIGAVIVWSVQANVIRHLRVYAAALSFAVLNGVVARGVHFFGGIEYSARALYGSAMFQVAISITWTILALGLMVTATRRGLREIWFTGTTLLGVVVVKLFLVDLAGIGTISRIVSFIVVGLLILLVGYLSPLPPEREEEQMA
jgi:uncharacterized membrane protein